MRTGSVCRSSGSFIYGMVRRGRHTGITDILLREPMPVAGDAERPLLNARRTVAWRSEG